MATPWGPESDAPEEWSPLPHAAMPAASGRTTKAQVMLLTIRMGLGRGAADHRSPGPVAIRARSGYAAVTGRRWPRAVVRHGPSVRTTGPPMFTDPSVHRAPVPGTTASAVA
ncbi:hypothetical protein GCM10010402_36670 [Actinomadura luteofluorescens]